MAILSSLNVKKILTRLFRITVKIIFVLILLFILLIFLIQTSFVQNFARKKIQTYLQGKLHTRVEVGSLYIGLPKKIILKNIYLEDQHKDTLLYGGNIDIDISMLRLLKSELKVNEVNLDDVTVKVKRLLPDSAFNFQYIIDAFAGGTEERSKPADSSSAFKFVLGKIHLQRIALTYKDDATGNDAFVYLGDFKTQIRTFDPDKMDFSVPDISLSKVKSHIRQYHPLLIFKRAADTVQQRNASGRPVSLQLGEIAFNEINADYRNEVSGQKADLQLGSFTAAFNSIDLQKIRFSLKEVALKNTTAVIRLGKNNAPQKKEPEKTAPASADTTNWQIELTRLNLDNNHFQFDNDNIKPQKTGIDYQHLDINNLTADAGDLVISPDEYKGKINQLALTEKSGLVLKKLSTGFLYSGNNAKLDKLYIQTNASTIKNQSVVRYVSLDDIARHPGDLYISTQFDHAVVAVHDLLIFVPLLAEQFKGREQSIIHLNGKVDGPLKNLNIPNLEIQGLQNTALNASGRIKGLPDAKKTYYDIRIAKLVTSSKDLQSLIPAGTLPSNIRIPEQLAAKGFFKGTFTAFTTQLNASTSKGSADISGSLNTGAESYDIKASTNGLDLGYLLKQESNFGKISLELNAKGRGFDYKKANAELNAKLLSGIIKGYEYKDLLVDGSLQSGSGKLHASIADDDDNIRFDLNANGRFDSKFPAVQMNLKLDTLNLQALHLVKDTLQLKLMMDADFANTDPDALQGQLQIHHISIANNKQKLGTDSIALTADHKDSIQDIRLYSEMALLDWKGQYKLTETGEAIKETIDKYYALAGFKPSPVSPQNWQLQMLLKPSPLVLQYMPQLKGTDSITANLNFNSASHHLDFALEAPKIQYQKQIIHALTVKAATKDSSLDYSIRMTNAGSPGFQLYQTALEGYLANNQLFAALLLKDRKAAERYHVAGRLSQIKDGLKFAFDADSLLLNYDKWNIARDNFIQYDSSGLIVNNLKLGYQEQSLSINSSSHSARAPIDIAFDNFRINTLTHFAEQDSLLMDGLLNGKAQVKNVLSNPVFTSDLKIDGLTYKKDTIGNMTIKVNNEQQNAYSADISLEGRNNDVKAEGTYYTGESKMDMKLNLGQLNLAVIKPFAAGQLKDIRGYLKGSLHASGNLDQPQLNGNLYFDSTFITPAISGETLQLSKDRIEFDQDGFNFAEFVLMDSAGNKATLDGNVYTKDFKEYRFDLYLEANNFRLVNAVAEPNRLFYGKLNIDAGIDVTGTSSSPKANADLRVNKETDFTLILPSNDPEVVNRQGVVVFADKNHPVDTARLKTMLDSLSRNSELKGMDVSANIETDSSAQFTMIIDERNGDALTLKGRADLSGGIDRSGKMSLTGNYELENGAYNVSLSVLKRKFTIQKGSTITWTGDPTKANVDITATYLVNTPSIDLVQQQLAGRSQAELNRFKQKLPFRVNLHMQGELLKPVITFDISLPEDELSLWPEVDNKLTQMKTDESEVNKQVFALLLLGRFVQENPFQSAAGGTDAEMLARQSASKILSDQLNQLAGSLIKGVDLSFDLNSEQDYSSGQAQTQTELTVGVSKSLFSDRVRVSVGSNFQLEQTNPGQNASNIAGDVNVDYRLSKDGRYMLRAYRKDQYESIVEGQVIETGLSFILTFDYDKFRELFHNRKEKERAKRPKHKKM